MKQDHFELFGLPRRFALDGAMLDRAYRDLQARVHPDKYAQASDAEKRVAMQWATRVNEAYQTLKTPLARARYLCELAGVDLGLGSNTAMPAQFLMQQMEWREALDAARATGNVVALDALDREIHALRTDELAMLARLLDETHDYAAAALHVRQLMFIEKFAEEVGDAYEALQA